MKYSIDCKCVLRFPLDVCAKSALMTVLKSVFFLRIDPECLSVQITEQFSSVNSVNGAYLSERVSFDPFHVECGNVLLSFWSSSEVWPFWLTKDVLG